MYQQWLLVHYYCCNIVGQHFISHGHCPAKKLGWTSLAFLKIWHCCPLVMNSILITWYHQFSFFRTLCIYCLVPITFIAEIKAGQFSKWTGSKYTQPCRHCSKFNSKYSKLYFLIDDLKQHVNIVYDTLSSILKWELQVLVWVVPEKTGASAGLLHSSLMICSKHT